MNAFRQLKPILGIAALLAVASSAAAQQVCRPPNIFTSTRKNVKASALMGRVVVIDIGVRGSGSGVRRAVADLTEAAELYRDICDPRKEFVAVQHLGSAYRVLGRADSALAAYRRAMSIAERLGSLDTLADGKTFPHFIGGRATAVATVNHYIGDVYRDLGRPDSAFVYYRKGDGFVRDRLDLNLAETPGTERDEDMPPQEAKNLNRATKPHATLAAVADVFRDVGRPDSALAYYRRAMDLARADGDAERIHFVGHGTMNMHEGRYLLGMGSAYLAVGEADSALAAFRKAQGLAATWAFSEWGQRRAKVDVLDGIARSHLAMSNSGEALRFHRDALAEARKIGDRWGETRALHSIGRLHHREIQPANLRQAVAYYDSANATFTALAGFAGGDANRLTIAERAVAMTQDAALAWLALEPEIGARPSAIAALASAERGRAQALLRLMVSVDSARPVGRVGRVEADAETIAAALGRSSSATLSYLVTRDTLIAWLTLPGGEIDVARQPLTRDSIGALVTTARNGLGVDGPTPRGRWTGEASAALTRDAMASRPDAGSPGAVVSIDDAMQASEALSSAVLPSRWRSRLSGDAEIVIVTHGPLTLLPFAALQLGSDAAGGSTTGGWGSAFAIRYAPSLAALIDLESRTGDVVTGPARFRDALIAGNPTMPIIRGEDGLAEALAPLPEAAEESRSIAERLGAAPLIGDAATERAVRARMSSARVIHLATHGFAFASDARARESFVALAADELHDGRLTVGEILDDPALRLQSDLVVLSACQTGLGDLKEAEGTVGLPRAFLARGARSVLVSLWSVSDEATRMLMERFYSHWLDGADNPTKARALQRAADDVRKTEGFEHPRFWAAFQIIGAE